MNDQRTDAAKIGILDLLSKEQQLLVPRWQRKYSWEPPQVLDLFEDLLYAGRSDHEVVHFGGPLLTFFAPSPNDGIKTLRIVDGQQRLVTISMLLLCISEHLQSNGACGELTAENVRDKYLTNSGGGGLVERAQATPPARG